MRRRFSMFVYGYVVMPEHVHLLVNEPEHATLADAIHYLKLSFAKRLRSRTGTIESRSFWQKRYYDRNVRDAREFSVKLRYLHRNRGPRQARFWLAAVEASAAWTGDRTGRVEVEQLSALCPARIRNRGDRIRMDRKRS